MRVANLCHREPVTIQPFEDLTTAASLMRDKHVGYLVVVEADPADGSLRPTGVVTDRDIVISVVAKQVDPRTLRVGDVMTRHPTVAAEGDAVEAAVDSMRRMGVRRLPVVGTRGQLVGVISLDDVVDALALGLSNVAGSIHNEQRIEGIFRP